MPVDADLILVNAQVITCDKALPQAAAVAVKGGRILGVGSNNDIMQLKGAGTREIDCQKGTLVPGFNDAHCHFFSLLRKFFTLDLSPLNIHSIDDIRESLRRKTKFTPAGNWIGGTDYNEFYLKEKRHPTRRDLDDVAPFHPVILYHRSMHACVLNSLGLKLTGVTSQTEEPQGGMIERDLDSGEPNGLLFNMSGYIQARINQPLAAAEVDWAAGQADRQYLSLGITSIGEATVSNNLARWQTFQHLKEAGIVRSRIDMLPGFAALREFKDSGLVTGAGDVSLSVGNLKIVLGEDDGQIFPSQPELNRAVLEACRNGFQVAIHAVERNSVAAAITALEEARRQFPHQPGRQRIEHCSECPPDLRLRLGRLQAVVVSQPPFIYYSGERYLSQVSPEVQRWLYPFKSLLDEGLIVAASSDSPVVFNNPLMGIYTAVTRRADSGDTVTPAEAVSVKQALEMYTLSSACAASQEKIKGSLTPGKLADIVVLNRNPLKAAAEELKTIRAEMTVIGGEIVWER
jgi:predicted amidohydrolase YtcJ